MLFDGVGGLLVVGRFVLLELPPATRLGVVRLTPDLLVVPLLEVLTESRSMYDGVGRLLKYLLPRKGGVWLTRSFLVHPCKCRRI